MSKHVPALKTADKVKATTIVLQSHRSPLPASWLESCIASVQQWAKLWNFEYRFINNELFDFVPKSILEKTQHQIVIATDLGRLKWLQYLLSQGYERAIWVDADFFIYAPAKFILPTIAESLDKNYEKYFLGREVWIQPNASKANALKAYIKVHNAFMVFDQGNSFLDFYTDTAERLLNKNTGAIPPQFIGPKLLTALHNVIQCSVLESAGMLSPSVIKDILQGGGAALDLFKAKSKAQAYGLNLCGSMAENEAVSNLEMEALIVSLVEQGEQLLACARN